MGKARERTWGRGRECRRTQGVSRRPRGVVERGLEYERRKTGEDEDRGGPEKGGGKEDGGVENDRKTGGRKGSGGRSIHGLMGGKRDRNG